MMPVRLTEGQPPRTFLSHRCCCSVPHSCANVHRRPLRPPQLQQPCIQRHLRATQRSRPKTLRRIHCTAQKRRRSLRRRAQSPRASPAEARPKNRIHRTRLRQLLHAQRRQRQRGALSHCDAAARRNAQTWQQQHQLRGRQGHRRRCRRRKICGCRRRVRWDNVFRGLRPRQLESRRQPRRAHCRGCSGAAQHRSRTVCTRGHHHAVVTGCVAAVVRVCRC